MNAVNIDSDLLSSLRLTIAVDYNCYLLLLTASPILSDAVH